MVNSKMLMREKNVTAESNKPLLFYFIFWWRKLRVFSGARVKDNVKESNGKKQENKQMGVDQGVLCNKRD